MNLWDRLKFWVASMRRVEGLELPDSGRSSIERGGFAGYGGRFNSVIPAIDFAKLALLKTLWIENPDFSQYVANIANLGNPGHEISVEAATPQRAEAAIARLNESASRLYSRGAGVDGLLNSYFAQAAWSGAISSEDIVNIPARRVERVVIVPVEQIRFEWDEDLGDYKPYQNVTAIGAVNNGGIPGRNPLNENTYRYLAVQTIDNLPYAKPPATAAISAIMDAQEPAVDNIKFISQKLGLAGLVSVGVAPPPRKPNETEAEFQARASRLLKSVRDALEGTFNKGLVVAFRDQKIEHTNIAAGANGTSELFQVIEEQVFSGLNSPPAMHGRTYSTTETYADVVYSLLLSQVGNFQRVVKRRQEMTYRLDLRLGGIDVDSVSLKFNKAHSRNQLADAQAEEVRIRNAFEKARNGIISPDAAAQELGYDSAFDAALLTGDSQLGRQGQQSQRLRFGFDVARNKYVHLPEIYEVKSLNPLETRDASNIVPIKKKATQLRALN